MKLSFKIRIVAIYLFLLNIFCFQKMKEQLLPKDWATAKNDSVFQKTFSKLESKDKEFIEHYFIRELILGVKKVARPTIAEAITDQKRFEDEFDPSKLSPLAKLKTKSPWVFLKVDKSLCNEKEPSVSSCPTVYDPVAKLEWHRILIDEDTGTAWNSTGTNVKGSKEAKALCDSLSASKSIGIGWRLPTQDEFFKSIFMLKMEQALKADEHYEKIGKVFPQTALDFTWSSEIFVDFDTKSAMAFSFAGKLESFQVDGKERPIRVRCVR